MSNQRAFLQRFGGFVRDDNGAAAIIMALMLPLFIAGLAFGAEVGFWELQRRKIQNAADMSAHSAAMQKRDGVTETDDLKDVAVAVATFGGYKGGDAGATVETPPSNGAYAGDPYAVRVYLQHSMQRRFSAIFSSAPIAFTVMATATVDEGAPACILALHPSAAGAVSVGGSGTATLTGCQVAANSTHSAAIQSTGNKASLHADCASTQGGVDDKHGAFTLDCGDPYEGSPPIDDPYADVAEPTVPSSCQPFSKFADKKNNPSTPASGTCYTLSKNEKVESDVLLSAGTYIFKGSGTLTLNGENSMTGDGVTLFFADGAGLKINGNFDLDIKAPKTGPTKGVAIFGSRTNAGDFDLSGGSGVAVVGAVYAPDSHITYTGNTSGFSSGECTQVVGGTVTLWGNSDFDTDCTNSGTSDITTTGGIKLVE